MKKRLATLLTVLATTGPLLSATEVERLRALCAEQEMQIRQLETKIARLTDTPPPAYKENSTVSAPASPVAPAGNSSYTVKQGDSIERIARRNGVSVAAITKLNGLKANSIIHPGQSIKLPGTTPTAAKAPENNPAAPETRIHTVQSGETFYSISQKYGVSVDDLIAANPSINHRALRIGLKINVTKPAKQIATAPAPEPASTFSAAPSIPVSNNAAPVEKPRASERPVRIDREITYSQFAKNHNTTTSRLDELNGLELDPSTVLAQGSELYTPAQP